MEDGLGLGLGLGFVLFCRSEPWVAKIRADVDVVYAASMQCPFATQGSLLHIVAPRSLWLNEFLLKYESRK